MKKIILPLLIKNVKIIKLLGTIFNVVSVVVLLMWLINKNLVVKNITFDKEALFVCLTTIAVFLNQFYKWLLSEAEYSPAYALALGYVNNFLEPVITQLIEDGSNNPLIYIYKPKNLSELNEANIDRTKAAIKNMAFELEELQLNLKQGRARDILTIQKSKTKKVFFDFPNTLSSLSAYIDYKSSSRANEFNDKEKDRITKMLFEKFYGKIDELTKQKNINTNIKYCDKALNIEF